MLDTSVLSQESYPASVVAAIALVGAAAVWVAGWQWNWDANQIATVLALLALLAAALMFAARRRIGALETALARRGNQASADFARSASDAIGKVGLYARELDAQYDDAHEELQRLRLLLDEAIGKLVASFSALNDLARRQRTLAQPYLTTSGGDADNGDEESGPSARLDALVEQFDRHVVDVVTTLQFQDIATQLVDHTRARISRAQMLSAGLGELVATLEMGAGATGSEQSEPIDHVGHVDRVRRMARSNPVATTCIAPGDVELF